MRFLDRGHVDEEVRSGVRVRGNGRGDRRLSARGGEEMNELGRSRGGGIRGR